jgi:predicted secreted protein
MPLSILATLFCCLPTGIAAIVYSAQANSKSQVGDTAGASQAAKNANIWLVISVVAALLFWFFVLIANYA